MEREGPVAQGPHALLHLGAIHVLGSKNLTLSAIFSQGEKRWQGGMF